MKIMKIIYFRERNLFKKKEEKHKKTVRIKKIKMKIWMHSII